MNVVLIPFWFPRFTVFIPFANFIPFEFSYNEILCSFKLELYSLGFNNAVKGFWLLALYIFTLFEKTNWGLLSVFCYIIGGFITFLDKLVPFTNPTFDVFI